MNRPISVLLVDDDQLVRDCLVAFLEDEGMRVMTASSAEDALEVIRRDPPRVCVTDMRLSGMDGEAFIIAAHDIAPQTRYLIHTGGGYLLSDDLRRIGMTPDQVLRKPLMQLSLFSGMIRALAGESPDGNAS